MVLDTNRNNRRVYYLRQKPRLRDRYLTGLRGYLDLCQNCRYLTESQARCSQSFATQASARPSPDP